MEDDVDWQIILQEELVSRGYKVDTVETLSDALALLDTAGPYNVVVTDISLSGNMPNTDGAELLRLVSLQWPTTVTIAMSGRVSREDVERFKADYCILDFVDRRMVVKHKRDFLSLIDRAIDRSKELVARGGSTWSEPTGVGRRE